MIDIWAKSLLTEFLTLLLFDYIFAGEPGLAGARNRQPQHGRPNAAHVRRGPAADLHADASRLVPALRQFHLLQETRPAEQLQPEGELRLNSFTQDQTV